MFRKKLRIITKLFLLKSKVPFKFTTYEKKLSSSIVVKEAIQRKRIYNTYFYREPVLESQNSNLQFNRNCTRLCMPIRPFGAHAIDFPFER